VADRSGKIIAAVIGVGGFPPAAHTIHPSSGAMSFATSQAGARSVIEWVCRRSLMV
jgi:hypothetical protein